MSTAEELAGLVTDRLGQLERTTDPADFTKPVCEIAFSFRLKPPTGLFTPHPSEPPSLLS